MKCVNLTRIIVIIAVSVPCLSASSLFSSSAAASGDRLIYPPLRTGIYSYRFVSEADDASALFVNPAGLGARSMGSSILRGSYEFDRLNELTAGLSFPKLGLGYSWVDRFGYKSSAIHLSTGVELAPGFSVGSGLKWHHTEGAIDSSPFTLDLGFLVRPGRYLSIGGVWENSNQPSFGPERLADTFTGGISIRPLTDRITLSAQGTFAEEYKPGWRGGASFEIVPGMEIFGAYGRENLPLTDETYEEFTAGIAFTFQSTTVRAATSSTPEGNYDYSSSSFSLENVLGHRRDAILYEHRLVEIKVGGKYVDEGGRFQIMGSGGKDLHALLRRLDSVKKDPDIDGLLLKINDLDGGFIGPVSAVLSEIRESVLEIRKAGKPVVAYLVTDGGASELYLASAADRIVMPEVITIGMIGVSLEVNRLKRAFEKFGVEWDHSTAGDYKSTFHIQYTDTSTAVQREELQGLVDEAYRLLVQAIAEGRGIDEEKMREISDGRIFTNDEALELGLIDAIGWEKAAKEELGKLAGLDDPKNTRTRHLGVRRYWKERWDTPPLVAVVGAYGGIESGKSGINPFTGGRTMGSESVVKSLKSASRYPGVRAIVFRVDSGGGSALASDEILNEIRRIQREEKIPVIVSMSNIAGSGGYWISMHADRIFADPFTITGSIGVVTAKPVIKGLYERLGVTNEVFKSGEHADAMSLSRHLTEKEMEMLEKHIDIIYQKFLGEVADGRGMDKEDVAPLAGGRLYFGTQAQRVNLVDELGGLKDAIKYAAESASIADDYQTVYFPAFDRFFFEKLPLSPIGVGKALWNLLGGADAPFDRTSAVD